MFFGIGGGGFLRGREDSTKRFPCLTHYQKHCLKFSLVYAWFNIILAEWTTSFLKLLIFPGHFHSFKIIYISEWGVVAIGRLVSASIEYQIDSISGVRGRSTQDARELSKTFINFLWKLLKMHYVRICINHVNKPRVKFSRVLATKQILGKLWDILGKFQKCS